MEREEGDHAAERCEHFEANYGRYRRELSYLILSNVRNKADAEEICDEAILNFVKTMKKQGWPKIDNVMGYLIRSAQRIGIRRARRSSKEQSLTDYGDEQSRRIRKSVDDISARENDPTTRYESILRSESVLERMRETILSDLSDEEWDLLYRHNVEQMNAEEIAKALGTDVYRVRYQINKLSAKIRYRARQFSKRAANS